MTRRQSDQPARRPPARSSRKQSLRQAALPSEIRQLLGAAPVTPLENIADYERLEAELVRAIQPLDAIEWLYLRNIADLVWDARRLREAKKTILALSRRHAEQSILGGETPLAHLSDEELRVHMREAVLNDDVLWRDLGMTRPDPAQLPPLPAIQPEQTRLDAALESAGLDQRAIDGEALRLCLADVERFDRLITVYETRRDMIIRDLYRRREALARMPQSPAVRPLDPRPRAADDL